MKLIKQPKVPNIPKQRYKCSCCTAIFEASLDDYDYIVTDNRIVKPEEKHTERGMYLTCPFCNHVHLIKSHDKIYQKIQLRVNIQWAQLVNYKKREGQC